MSAPTSNPTGNTPPTGSSPSGNPTTGGSAPAGGSGTPAATGSTGASAKAKATVGSSNITFVERLIADPTWPSTLILDLSEGNWIEWSRRVTLISERCAVPKYLKGTLACPDPTTDPDAHEIWGTNNTALHAFMLVHMTSDEFEYASPFDTSHAVFEALRTRHEKLGPHAQINLLLKEFSVFYEPSIPMTTTSKQLRNLHERMKKMGKINEDKLFLFVIINALGRHYPQLQSDIHGMTDDPNFDWAAAIRCIDTEAALAQRRAEMTVTPTTIALVGTSGSDPKTPVVVCSNCKRLHHTIDFCIKSGGKMAGRTLEEAKAAQRAAAGKQPCTTRGSTQNSNANVATTATQNTNNAGTNTNSTTTTPTAPASSNPTPITTTSTAPTNSTPITINGISYIPVSTPLIVPQQTANICDHTGAPYRVNDLLDFRGMVAELETPIASLDWEHYSRTTDPPDVQSPPVAFASTPFPAACLEELPFVLDTGATCHISPECSDFQNLRSIQAHPIKGLGGSCVYATGLGTIQLDVGNGQQLILHNALFAPSSSVRLISVLTLNRDSKTISCFDENVCWVLDKKTGTTIAQGAVSNTRNLYLISHFAPHIVPNSFPSNHTTLYASRVPDVETWHRRLGHCNTRTIIDMARNNAVKGMPVNLSAMPPRCEHCILGKQARTPVPKMREGLKATKRLERVFVDLCGPMSSTSKSGHLYAMNIIDDFSSYVWTIPLKSKGDAAQALQFWHRLVENQSGERLRTFGTDNGELLSHAVTNWCSELGVGHLLTAPYTSAHNGRVERLHRTLLEKARTMRLACNAPDFMWDEFCVTAAYLTTLTATSSLNGKTPFELWFGHPPSLSHLREIGCKAFALVLTHNPKLLQRSVPCVLIGYAPHAKAYRLWNPASGRVFNSYHVTFIEHLDAIPANLMPGTLVNLDEQGILPSWDSSASEMSTTAPNPLPPSNFINPSSSLHLPISSSISGETAPIVPTLATNVPIMTPSIPNQLPSRIIPSETSNSSSPVIPHPVITPPSSPPRIPSVIPPPITVTPPSPPPRAPSPPPPPLCRSPRTHVPLSRDASRDGLLPDTRLSGALSDVRASALRRQEERAARRATQSDDHTQAFLSEFSPLRRTHLLFPADLDSNSPILQFSPSP